MHLTDVLDRPELCGGVKVVFQHAQLLHARGHRVTILGAGERPTWIRFDGDYVDWQSGPPALRPQDLVIATYWTTVDVAEGLDRGPVAHFCQDTRATCRTSSPSDRRSRRSIAARCRRSSRRLTWASCCIGASADGPE